MTDDEEEEDTVLNFVDEESETDESDTEPERDGGIQEKSFDDVNMMEVYRICLWQHVLVELLKAGAVHIFAVSNIHSNFYSLSDPVEESSQSQCCFCPWTRLHLK